MKTAGLRVSRVHDRRKIQQRDPLVFNKTVFVHMRRAYTFLFSV